MRTLHYIGQQMGIIQQLVSSSRDPIVIPKLRIQNDFDCLLMRESCHLERPSDVEIGVNYQMVFVVVFFKFLQ